MNVATAPEVDPTKPPPAEYLPDYDQFVTEDDAPVDNFFSEKQQRLLTSRSTAHEWRNAWDDRCWRRRTWECSTARDSPPLCRTRW